MGRVGGDWYGRNGDRAYPVDDSATWVDDAGGFAPPDILVDAQLAFPSSHGPTAYVAALAAGPNVVTAIIAAEAGAFTPLAAVTVAGVTPGVPYPVRPMAPGVGGWVVFGPDAVVPYSGRFSSAGQSRLLARCARAYAAPPVPSIGKLGLATTLSGLVTLVAGSDLAISIRTMTIAGLPRRAIVIGLASSFNQNVFDIYAGTCKARPEAGNCRKTPLRAINGVGPDCNGNVDINFIGVAAAAAAGGIMLSLPVSLAASCGNDGLPGTAVPGTYPDRCASENSLGSFTSSHN